MSRPVAHLANLDLNLLVALRGLHRRIALMQERLAARLADRADLRVLECPGSPEPITEALWWHLQHEEDTAHAWLRRLIVETARRL
jgi:DNA-binding transcriptional LysR family regulator